MLLSESLDGVENIVGQESNVALISVGSGSGFFFVFSITFVESVGHERSDNGCDDVHEGKDTEANDDGHQEIVVDASGDIGPTPTHLKPGRSAKLVTESGIDIGSGSFKIIGKHEKGNIARHEQIKNARK